MTESDGPRIVRVASPGDHALASLSPIRTRRRLLLLGELSFNGLSGFGANVGYQLTRFFAVDAGVGLAAQMMPKVGLRARFDFLRGTWSPFAAFGATFVPGQRRAHLYHSSSGLPYTLQFNSIAMATGMLGMSCVKENGFTFLGGFGAALRVTRQRPYTRVPATYGISSIAGDLIYDHGLLLSLAFGYSF